MACSPEQLAANRRNAAKSTGPKSAEGKARSRRNALKHGLTGEGVAVPDEDQAAIEGRFEAFEADLKPKDSVAQYLVRRAALLSVRIERSARQESAEITRAMLGAGQADADARAEEINGLAASVDGDDPAEAVRKLRRTPEGLAWLIRAWRALKADHARGWWKKAQLDRTEQLLGRKPLFNGTSRVYALTEATTGSFRLLAPADWPDLEPIDRRQAALDELGAIVDAEIGRLEGEVAGLDRESIARCAATAPARALFDASPKAILARKYEAVAEREFYRALKQVEQLNAREQGVEPPADLDANHSGETERGEMGSFFPRPSIESGPSDRGNKPGKTRPNLPADRAREDKSRGSRPSVGMESCWKNLATSVTASSEPCNKGVSP